MKIDHPIPIGLLNQLISLDAETGALTWLSRPEYMFSESKCGKSGIRPASWSCAKWNTKHAGTPALNSDNGKGYKVGTIFGKKYRAHNVVWALNYGEWPCHVVDHIDGNPGNNSIENLRLATTAQNAMNRSLNSNNSSGRKGVSFYKKLGKWMAYIRKDGVQFHLGYFDNIEDAASAYEKASKAYHGEFGRLR